MSEIEIIILSLLQGLTEFLPISSSAHLIFPSQILGWIEQGLAFDVAVHVGTLLAVVIYYRNDVLLMSREWFSSIGKSRSEISGHGLLSWYVIFATIPAALFGFFGNEIIESHLRSLSVIALTTIVFGLLLGYADIKAKENRALSKITLKDSMLIGFAQALALIPGTSRSGITMTVGMLIGLKKECAARFSFLLSIPVITMAGGYISSKLLMSSEENIVISDMLFGGMVAFVGAYLSIHFFIKLIGKLGMMPFVIYRILLGLALCYLIYIG